MLDFYAIPDDAAFPDYPDEDLHIGSIDMAQHERLSKLFEKLGVREPPPYFEDSRYKSAVVAAIYETLVAKAQQKALEPESSRESFDAYVAIVRKAKNQGNGIVTFCD